MLFSSLFGAIFYLKGQLLPAPTEFDNELDNDSDSDDNEDALIYVQKPV